MHCVSCPPACTLCYPCPALAGAALLRHLQRLCRRQGRLLQGRLPLIAEDLGVITPPVEARVEGPTLVIASSEHPRESYALEAIRHVEVQKVEQGKTTALVLGLSLGFVGAAFAAPLAFR